MTNETPKTADDYRSAALRDLVNSTGSGSNEVEANHLLSAIANALLAIDARLTSSTIRVRHTSPAELFLGAAFKAQGQA